MVRRGTANFLLLILGMAAAAAGPLASYILSFQRLSRSLLLSHTHTHTHTHTQISAHTQACLVMVKLSCMSVHWMYNQFITPLSVYKCISSINTALIPPDVNLQPQHITPHYVHPWRPRQISLRNFHCSGFWFRTAEYLKGFVVKY